MGRKPSKLHLLKRTLQLVTSVSLVSLFICYSTGFSVFPNSFNVYFSAYLFTLFARTLERKYMFLLCNGILAFVATTSVPHYASSSSVSNDAQLPVVEDFPFAAGQQQQGKQEKEDEEQQQSGSLIDAEEDETEEAKGSMNLVRQQEDTSEAMINGGLVQEEEEDDDDGGGDDAEEIESLTTGTAANEDVTSTEELNKKIEEFIRKMKEEIRIEARQQLIAV